MAEQHSATATSGFHGPRRSTRLALGSVAFLTFITTCTFSLGIGWGSTPAGSTVAPTGKAVIQSSPPDGPYEASIEGGPASAHCAPDEPLTARADAPLNSLFDHELGPGWLGGDIGYSTALPDGKESFVFGDTLLGHATASGVASLKAFVHGSEMVGTMPDLATDITGTLASPQSLIPDDTPPNGWQSGAIYVEGGDQLMFVNEVAPVAGSMFATFTGRSGIAVFSLSSGVPRFSSITPLPTDPITQWGVAMTQSGGYDYVFGEAFNTNTDAWHGMKLARVPVGSSLETSEWTFWNGSAWLGGEANAAAEPVPFVTGVIPLKNGSGFMGVGTGGTFGQPMRVSVVFACSPTGPWSKAQTIYSIPETTQYPDEFAYMATFHPEISSDGGLITSYSVDSLDGLSALEANVHQYQPRFIDIGLASDIDPPVATPEVAASPLLPITAIALFGLGIYLHHRRARRGRRRGIGPSIPGQPTA